MKLLSNRHFGNKTVGFFGIVWNRRRMHDFFSICAKDYAETCKYQQKSQ